MSTARGEAGTQASGFTALDAIAVVVTVVALGSLWGAVAVWRPAMLRMFDDFGTLGDATLTRWVASPLAFALPVVPTLLLAAAMARTSLARRRALVVSAFVGSLVGLAIIVSGLYLPLWQLTAAVGPE